MSPARQVVALIALGVVAGAAGFAGAAAIGGGGPSVPPTAVATPVAVVAAPAAPGDPAAPPEAPGPPPPAARPKPRPRPAPPTPAPRPAPEPEPKPAPAPPPEPPAASPPFPPPPPPEDEPAPPPPPPERPPPDVLEEPAPPPTGVAIPPESAVTGVEAAHAALAGALAGAALGSVEESDLRRSLLLWKRYLGPEAAAVPTGRRATIARALRANAWWFGDRGSPRGRVLLRDEDGVILTYRPRRGFIVNPVATTGRWRGLNDDVPAPALAEALLEMGVARDAGERGFLAWEYYDVEGDPAAIVPGASAMAQARVALLMAHAHEQTADPRFSEAALRALAAFTVDVDRGGVRSMVRVDPGQDPAPWYVERAYPGEDPWTGAALNGFMVTLLNLRGAAALLDRPGADVVASTATALARDLADRGALTLQRHLPDHDSGAWSYYGLLTPGRPWRSYLADLNYHCYHVRLLAELAQAYPALGFAATSDRWQGYVDAAGVTCPARP